MSASPLTLVREDLHDFGGYASARSELQGGRDLSDAAWLNANESPWPNRGSGGAPFRRYPDPQPAALRARLAELYGCEPSQLLIGRGSDEGIDLLVRALCRPGVDAVLTTPPTFGMYAVCARLHGARVVEVPLLEQSATDGSTFDCDLQAVAQAVEGAAVKLVFLCSPGNPCGNLIALEAIKALARRLDGRALVVVDEAYLEYADQPSAVTLLANQSNIAVLRTLSKAHALAAVRIGCVIADARLIALMQRCQAPYPVPTPCAELALRALGAQSRETTDDHVATILAERELLFAALSASAQVRQVYRSHGNFLLVRFLDVAAAFACLLAAGVVVRPLASVPGLSDALRISVGRPDENSLVISTIASMALLASEGVA